jgi:hypothetical protein
MFDDNVDQIEILKAFPDYRWKALTERMRYYFGKGWGRPTKARKSTWQRQSGQIQKKLRLSK